MRGGRLLSAKLHQKSLTLVGNFPENFRHLSYTFVFVKHSRYHCVKSVRFRTCLEQMFAGIGAISLADYLLPDVVLPVTCHTIIS